MKLKLYFSLAIILCSSNNPTYGRTGQVRKESLSFMDKTDPITIFVHGTLFPVLSALVHKVDCPLGLTLAKEHQNSYVLGRIGYILDKVDPQQFPLEATYLYGWSGKLSYRAREREAETLYNSLRGCKGPITIIGHSHGCNLILNLAKVVKKNKDTELTIDKIVLLAPPVQAATSKYIKSPLFKRIISLYSSGDWTQVIDPQGLRKKKKSKKKHDGPFFSQRRFAACKNLVQAQIFLDDKHPWHMDFVLPKFVDHLPAIVKMLDNVVGTIDVTVPELVCKINIAKSKNKLELNVEKHDKDKKKIPVYAEQFPIS